MSKFYLEIMNNVEKIGIHPDFKDYSIFYNHKKRIGFIDTSFDDLIVKQNYSKLYRNVRKETITIDYLSKQKIRASSQFAFITKFSNRTHFDNVLDIGTSSGALLKEFEYTSNLYGFEPDENMFNFTKQAIPKVNIFNSVFNPYLLPKSVKFDLITLSHVFEHLSNPIEKLQTYLNHLTNDGYIFIEVPYDDKRLLKQIVNSQIVGLYHTYFYQPKSIKNIIHEAGGNIVSLKIFGYNRSEFNYVSNKKSIIQKIKGLLKGGSKNSFF